MSIDSLGQHGEEVTLPDDIKSRLENARNNITVYEGEFARLQKLCKQETDTIHALGVEKDSLTKSIASLKTQTNNAVNELASKKAELTVLEGQIGVAKKKLDDTNTEASKIVAEHTARSATLDNRETTIKAVATDLNTRHIALLAAEGAHNAKVEKLKKALE